MTYDHYRNIIDDVIRRLDLIKEAECWSNESLELQITAIETDLWRLKIKISRESIDY